MPAAKKRASGGTAGSRPLKRARDDIDDADLISNLPDVILGTIISLLPTKDGARTQAIARRWRPLWRSAPLNVDAEDLSTDDSRYETRRRGPRPTTKSIISTILSDHPGPVRRFDFRLICIYPTKRGYGKDAAHIESWLRSPSLDNLEELNVFFPISILADQTKFYPLPSSVLRFASTLVVATIGYCDFPNEILASSLNFPLLKHLTIQRVSISEDIFHGVFSACHVLETLFLQENDMAYLHISSPTLTSIGFEDCYVGEGGLVIEDTPNLERLLCLGLDCGTIRVNRAPKLGILGPLSPRNSNIQIGNLVFQGLIPTSLNNSICTVKVLALRFTWTNLDAVLNILRFFPCLEKLHVLWNKFLKAKMENVHHYDPLDPIKCLETHLKKIVLKNYKGDERDVSFAKFFLLSAKVLDEIKFELNEMIDEKWVADQHGLLEVETKASPDAQIKFIRGSSYLNAKLDIHDLSTSDPFNSLCADRPFRRSRII
ncbi:F-box/FBD/LRR-repeat protein At4g00160-like [Lolium perenne]|uniref:F-box/FBD/LRR-repeat protein At4g00160-like n=1 Tax=Lolium perenne TaxID=4522 RepID=UPI0021EB1DFC|nr:F-box/FBD/LRR-repeat protein At4g00160-like [Lolium perenne]